ncbi:MAG: tetratricopeptide repeat protein [Bacteroidetes bacterium]|nr:tetratricopeptide repeat protein [Bacteroidota bacterium]
MDEYNKAIEYFNNKEYPPAEKVLLNLLEQNYNDYDVLNFLGIIQLYLENFKKAINYFNQVIFLYDRHSIAYYHLAYCHEKNGNNDLAINNYKKAINIDPKFIDSYLNLGQLLILKDEFTEAEKLYNTAIENNPELPQSFNNLANLYLKLSKWQNAIANYKIAIKLDPDNCDYYFNIGSCYAKQEEYELAIENFEKAIQLKPDHIGAKNNSAIIYSKQNNNKKAIELYHQLLLMDVDNAEALFNLANAYQNEKDYDKAISYYKKAIDADPELKGSYISIGRIFLQKGDTETAEDYFIKAVDDEQNRIISFTNLGVVSLEDLKLKEAISFFDIAIKSKSDLAEAHYNKAHALLLSGNYEDGWKEYEWRKERKDFIKPKLSKPELSLKDLTDKRILIYAEQGLGDTIQFVRYLKLLKEKNCYIIFLCEIRIICLFKDLPWIDEIIIYDEFDESKVNYDYQIALLSLPYYFQTNKYSIPAFKNYLTTDAELNCKWYEKIRDNEHLKVGLIWAGNPKNTRDKLRSIPFQKFLQLFSISGVDYYSLQVGPAAEQLKDFQYPINNLERFVRNFDDSAAAINNLDLVISVDTSIGHLTGALGKPVWNLIGYLPDWRWLLNQKSTPWYPSMRIYRQQKKGDWESVVNEVTYDLQKLVAEKKGEEKKCKVFSTRERVNTVNNYEVPLYLGLSDAGNYGWGVCSNYLRSELTGKVIVKNVNASKINFPNERLPGYFLNAITSKSLKGLHDLRGIKTYGYTFFEDELTESSKINATKFDVILAGSSWCVQKLKDAGIANSEVLTQGIDPKLFYPGGEKENDNLFVIFSGGKFELRKGQDLVLQAFKIMHQKYPDIILVNTWYNRWQDVMASMQSSKYIKYDVKGKNWQEMMTSIYKANDINPSNIFTLPLVPNEKMRDLYLKSDVGLFPNRCEGGTNLVMMEYMACGKTVIASYNSGHKDILTDENSLPLKSMTDFKLFNENKKLIADWSEPALDEIIEKIEYAYRNRDKLKSIGINAAEHIKKLTWTNTAEKLIQIIYE